MRPRLTLPILLLGLLLAGCDSTDTGDGNGSALCPLQVTEHVTEPTTWDCDEVYVQLSPLRVEDHLTIMPGTEVTMSEGTHIIVRGDGKLTANGLHPDSSTFSEPTIIFRGEEPRKNYWGGIAFMTISAANELHKVRVSDTGAPGFQGNRWAVAVLGGGVPAGLAFVGDIHIANAGGMGVSLWQGADLLIDADPQPNGFRPGVWTFEDVDDVVVGATFDTAGELPRLYYDSGVRRPWVRVEYGELNREVNWASYVSGERVYRIVETPRIGEDGILTIQPGSTNPEVRIVLEFAQDVRLGSGSGNVRIRGNEENPILLTGVAKIPGYWGGLTFQSVGLNVIRNAVVEYAGGQNFNRNPAAVYVTGDAEGAGSVTIENSTIRESADIGIWIRQGGVASLTDVTFENNGGQNIVDDNL